MRGACVILAILVIVCSAGFTQQTNSPAPNTTTATTSMKMSGCLMSINGTFYLLTANQERFMLKGKHSSMFSHNGQQVEVTVKAGKEASAQGTPTTLTVTHIEQLAQVCR